MFQIHQSAESFVNPRHEVGFAGLLILDNPLNRLRFEVAEDLLDLGAELVDETGRQRLSGAHLLLAVQITRATHIFEGVIALCRIGRGVPASMLNRALLEDALDVHWVARNPDVAPERADEHEQLIRLGERAMDMKFGRPTTALSRDEKERFAELSKHFDGFHASWTLSSHSERVGLVKDRWGEEAGRDIEFTYQVIQRQNNVLLHPSPSAYGLAMSPGRGQINRIGPDPRWRDALSHGVLGYYLTCRVVAEEFGINKDPVAKTFNLASCLLKPVPASELEALPPGAPCPCGSERHVDVCHGVVE
jgi:hypothetical protein